jgi:hypothetical protein
VGAELNPTSIQELFITMPLPEVSMDPRGVPRIPFFLDVHVAAGPITEGTVDTAAQGSLDSRPRTETLLWIAVAEVPGWRGSLW